MEFFLPQISHWQISHASYETIPNQKATWFVDPPYSNIAGSRYRCNLNTSDFISLQEWVKSRIGQTITCENAGAAWDDFKPLRTRLGFKSSYQKSNAMEVFCERNTEDVFEG